MTETDISAVPLCLVYTTKVHPLKPDNGGFRPSLLGMDPISVGCSGVRASRLFPRVSPPHGSLCEHSWIIPHLCILYLNIIVRIS